MNYEKNLLETELERQNREAEEKKAREALIRKNYQGDVLRQVNERDRDQRRLLQEKMYEERAAKLAEINYVRKIDTQKQTNNEVLQNWRSQF